MGKTTTRDRRRNNRKYAQMHVSIWDDDDYLERSSGAQWLYKLLFSHPSLTWCGAMDWRPGKLAAKASDMTKELIIRHAAELEAHHYIIIDQDTEEVIVRSFVRNDGLLKSPNMGVAVSSAIRDVGSNILRGVIVNELHRLMEDQIEDVEGDTEKIWGAWKHLEPIMSRERIVPNEVPWLAPEHAPSAPMEHHTEAPDTARTWGSTTDDEPPF